MTLFLLIIIDNNVIVERRYAIFPLQIIDESYNLIIKPQIQTH